MTLGLGRATLFLDRRQLEAWLLPRHPAPLSERALAKRFVLAALRDLYSTDYEVAAWLALPRTELGGSCANDLLDTRRVAEVEALAVRAWNAG